MRYLDTNVILRYLIRDDLTKFAASEALFQRIESGEEEVTTSSVVVAEVLYVLTGRGYRVDRVDAARFLRPVLTLRGLRIAAKSEILHALDLFEAMPGLDFEDCLIAAQMYAEDVDELYSYDRGFDRIPGLKRIEPSIP